MTSSFIRTLSLAIISAALCPAQTAPWNPRATADDPRIGLKGGLYDAGEAAFGMERLASLPKPAGFAPGNAFPSPEPPPELASAPGHSIRLHQLGPRLQREPPFCREL